MDNNGVDKRKYTRIYFPVELEIEGILALSEEPNVELRVKILNLSEGGLFFTVMKDRINKIPEGYTAVLKGMRNPDPINFDPELGLEIKWVSDHDFLESIGYGGEFVKPQVQYVKMFRDMVADFLTGGPA